MFSEPQTVTVDAVADSLPRIAFGDRSGIFANASTGHVLRISHTEGKRNRRTVRLDFTKTAADPLLDGVSRQYSMSAYLVIDHPLVGFDSAEAVDNTKALLDWLGTTGHLTKVVGGES